MVMKMLATATTDWSADIAMAMAAAVQATSITVNMKMKKASAVRFNPINYLFIVTQFKKISLSNYFCVHHTYRS